MKNRASATALGIATVRAVESARPIDQRLFFDPFAARFVPRWMVRLTNLLVRTRYPEWRGPGVLGFLLARTRLMDDFVLSAVHAGVRQLVILGAGYDARAFRFADTLKPQVRVFEVDHPATQAEKLAELNDFLVHPPIEVTYVPVDFMSQSLVEQLTAFGYDDSLKSAFVWEGVTMYLTPEAVDDTLAFISKHSPPGSSLVFDYVYSSVLHGEVERGEVKGMRRYHRFTNEELVFGIPEGTATDFLSSRGFSAITDLNGAQLEELYTTEWHREPRPVARGYGIVTARVAARADA
jgi:methyltransferase (TIGR00027 family)